MNPEIPETGRVAAAAVASAFGGTPNVRRHPSTRGDAYVDVMTCRDRPLEGYACHTTLGVEFASNLLDGNDVRVEIAGVSLLTTALFPQLLADIGLRVVEDHWLAAPGVTYPNLVRQRNMSETLDHLLLVPPFPWPNLSRVYVGPSFDVHWLLAVPISESERRFVVNNGFDVFEELMQREDVPYWDLSRDAVA